MRRLFLLIILSLFMISAAVADGLQVRVPKECRCYSENEIMISTDHDTVAVLRITDSMGNNWRTIRQELTAGMNVLLWDGLGEFEEKLEYVPYTLTVEADGETASASFEVTSSETALQLALPSSETLYNDKYWFV